jgi:hypothetical protein
MGSFYYGEYMVLESNFYTRWCTLGHRTIVIVRLVLMFDVLAKISQHSVESDPKSHGFSMLIV